MEISGVQAYRGDWMLDSVVADWAEMNLLQISGLQV